MSGLERTVIGPFTLDTAVPVDQFTRESLPALMLPATAAVPSMPQFIVDESSVQAIANGRTVMASPSQVASRGESSQAHTAGAGFEDQVAVVDAAGQLIAFAEVRAGRLHPCQVFATRR
jgi:tRNA U55 pseudouridine synthase TruB